AGHRGLALYRAGYADLRRPLRAGARGARGARRRLSSRRGLGTDPRVAAADKPLPLLAREVAARNLTRPRPPCSRRRWPDGAVTVVVDRHKPGAVGGELRVRPSSGRPG